MVLLPVLHEMEEMEDHDLSTEIEAVHESGLLDLAVP